MLSDLRGALVEASGLINANDPDCLPFHANNSGPNPSQNGNWTECG
jgi:hypothetical protein